jgi:hypothetical protein
MAVRITPAKFFITLVLAVVMLLLGYHSSRITQGHETLNYAPDMGN